MATGTRDEDLLEAFLAGRRSALGDLARRYEQTLLGLVGGLLGHRRELAMDVVQETWVRVIRFGGNFNGRSSFKTWIYRIAINQCLSTMRSLESCHPDLEQMAQQCDRGSGDRPDDDVENGERNVRLKRLVSELAPEHRAIVLLCYHEGTTHAQAAEILDIPIGTLKSRLHTALEELRRRLGSEIEV